MFFGVKHDGASEPLVIVVEIAFEQKYDAELFHVEIAWLFLEEYIESLFPSF